MLHAELGVPRRRIALYSHDTQGLGHVRRNISIASALVESDPATDVLLLTGAPEAAALPLPANTEIVTLPTLHKDVTGSYRPKTLGLPLTEVLGVRGQIVAAALDAFAPDLFVVDKAVRGVHGELDLALRALRGTSTTVVLGLRDVLDSPAATVQEWEATGTTAAIQDYYDEVWVYGDPQVFDAAAAYDWPWAVRRKLVYTGYLADHRPDYRPPRSRPGGVEDQPLVPTGPYVLCLVGGGQDGAALAEAFVASPLPAGHHGVLVTGPYMSQQRRRSLAETASTRPELVVHGFTDRTHELVAGARAAVTMGGYNSVCELLAARCPALVVPRTVPRLEQAVRAAALAQVGWVDTLHPDDLSPARIGTWLSRTVTRPRRMLGQIDLDGLVHLRQRAEALLTDHHVEAEHHAAV
ncbi:glycosyltransferase family protein [Ruania albidiflava]|uniref:glycosyltransferase family protein n=1 Tax=Ruania albidiflava TaxID=366586 RepID=UPI000406B0C8|nr:glycosyltransferase [Ruania albidiflava]